MSVRWAFSDSVTKNRCSQPRFCTVGGKGPKWSYQPCQPCNTMRQRPTSNVLAAHLWLLRATSPPCVRRRNVPGSILPASDVSLPHSSSARWVGGVDGAPAVGVVVELDRVCRSFSGRPEQTSHLDEACSRGVLQSPATGVAGGCGGGNTERRAAGGAAPRGPGRAAAPCVGGGQVRWRYLT